jgi:hypothetical protein
MSNPSSEQEKCGLDIASYASTVGSGASYASTVGSGPATGPAEVPLRDAGDLAGEVILAQDSVEIVVGALAVQDEVAPQTPFAPTVVATGRDVDTFRGVVRTSTSCVGRWGGIT